MSLAVGQKRCSFRILPKNCSISSKSLSLREAFLSASFGLSEGNHRAESPPTVTHLLECDLAMSWLLSGQNQGATWGLSQTEAPETEKLQHLFSLNVWEKSFWMARSTILLLSQKCEAPSVRSGFAKSAFQLLGSLSCDEDEGPTGPGYLRLLMKTFWYLPALSSQNTLTNNECLKRDESLEHNYLCRCSFFYFVSTKHTFEIIISIISSN